MNIINQHKIISYKRMIITRNKLRCFNNKKQSKYCLELKQHKNFQPTLDWNELTDILVPRI